MLSCCTLSCCTRGRRRLGRYSRMLREAPVTRPLAVDDDAVALLRSLSGPHGIRASLSSTANYQAIFARDAVMAGVAGLLLGDPVVSAGLVRTLESLRTLQGAEGQIASNYEMRPDKSAKVSFGTLAPRIDSATWFLVGIGLAARAKVLDAGPFRESAAAVVRLLDGIEYNGRHLMYIPAGGNWADEYIYDGYILYDQVLRAWGLRLLGAEYGIAAWREKSEAIGKTIEQRYWPDSDGMREHPIASYSPLGVRDIFDLAASSLLGVSGIAPHIANKTLGWIRTRYLDRSELPPAFSPVIDESHPDWPALRRYHLHEFRNRPHEYHNGGIWPIWLGWLALALDQGGHDIALGKLRAAATSRIDRPEGFRFEEFLHGTTGVPGGTTQMAYSATGLVMLRLAGSSEHRHLMAS